MLHDDGMTLWCIIGLLGGESIDGGGGGGDSFQNNCWRMDVRQK